MLIVSCQRNSEPSWPESEIFSDDMFGSAMGDPENLYQINSGWFKDITSLYDPDLDFELDFIDPGHNAYGPSSTFRPNISCQDRAVFAGGTDDCSKT